jgi:hypothetical protein
MAWNYSLSMGFVASGCLTKELEGHGKYFICNTSYLSQKMNSNINIPFTAHRYSKVKDLERWFLSKGHGSNRSKWKWFPSVPGSQLVQGQNGLYIRFKIISLQSTSKNGLSNIFYMRKSLTNWPFWTDQLGVERGNLKFKLEVKFGLNKIGSFSGTYSVSRY